MGELVPVVFKVSSDTVLEPSDLLISVHATESSCRPSFRTVDSSSDASTQQQLTVHTLKAGEIWTTELLLNVEGDGQVQEASGLLEIIQECLVKVLSLSGSVATVVLYCWCMSCLILSDQFARAEYLTFVFSLHKDFSRDIKQCHVS